MLVFGELDEDTYAWLYALDIETGIVRWSFPFRRPLFNPEAWAVEGLVFLSAANDDGKDIFYAIDDLTGSFRWSRLGSYVGRPRRGTTRIHFLFKDIVSSVDLLTGVEHWLRNVNAGAVLEVSGTMAYVADNSGVQALDAVSGHFRWRFDTGGRTYIERSTETDVIVLDDEHGVEYCLDATTGIERPHSDSCEPRRYRVESINGRIYVPSCWRQEKPALAFGCSLSALDAVNCAELWSREEQNCLDLSISRWIDGTLLLNVKRIGRFWPVLKVIDKTSGKDLWSLMDWRPKMSLRPDIRLICVLRSEDLVGLDGVDGTEVWRIAMGNPTIGGDWTFITSQENSTYVTDGASLYGIDFRRGQSTWRWQVSAENLARPSSPSHASLIEHQDHALGEFQRDRIRSVYEYGSIIIVSQGRFLHALAVPPPPPPRN